MIVLIGMSALCVTSCAGSREATAEQRELSVGSSVFRDSSRVESLEVLDTLREVTTITIRENEKGDTIMVKQVTERDRIKNRDRVSDNHEKTVIRTDTVSIEKRDSVYVNTNHAKGVNGKSGGLVGALRWIFWIIVALAGLVLIVKIRR